jgi:serine protease AprX
VNATRFEGQGELVAGADTGFDTGSTTDVHPAFKGRVHKLVGLGRPGRSDDPQGHGTHVAGSVLGDGESATMGGRIRGTAPQATLYLQSTLDSGGGLGGLPPDLRDLFTPAYQESARVHTNSWGSTVPGLPYDSSAREIDAMVWENQDLVICFAAGNDGTDDNGNGVVDAGSIGSQAAAKNCITVGASENDRPDFAHTYGEYWPGNFRVKPLSTDLQADDPEGMVAFSSRGPTQEGRIKPDVVAPGTCILSTLSRAVRRPSTDFGESGDPLFFFDSGTSMATPLVAGCVAVLRSALRAHDVAPSAALVKAMLVNGAVAIPGQFTPSETGASPNANSGFGRVDLARSIVVEPTGESSGFVDGEALEMGGEHTVTIDVPRGRTLTATLVWTDPPGPGLQNDLDLIVKAGSRERHGNRGTAADFDRSNNVERVVWPRIPAGTVTLTVRAFRITTSSQPFACVWRVD